MTDIAFYILLTIAVLAIGTAVKWWIDRIFDETREGTEEE